MLESQKFPPAAGQNLVKLVDVTMTCGHPKYVFQVCDTITIPLEIFYTVCVYNTGQVCVYNTPGLRLCVYNTGRATSQVWGLSVFLSETQNQIDNATVQDIATVGAPLWYYSGRICATDPDLEYVRPKLGEDITLSLYKRFSLRMLDGL